MENGCDLLWSPVQWTDENRQSALAWASSVAECFLSKWKARINPDITLNCGLLMQTSAFLKALTQLTDFWENLHVDSRTNFSQKIKKVLLMDFFQASFANWT
jgi:hypothetical protein